MDAVTRAFVGIAGLCFAIPAAAVGLRIYQSDALAGAVVGGVLAIGALLALAVVLAVAVRLHRVSREAREDRLIIARTLTALTGATSSPATSAPALDPQLVAMIAGLLGVGETPDQVAGGGDAGRWAEVERPRIGGGNGHG